MIDHAGDKETLQLIGSVVGKIDLVHLLIRFFIYFLPGGAAGCLIDSLIG